jgi:hypothetical protein
MNTGKSMLKVDLAKSLGKQYAEMAHATVVDEYRQEGARDALKHAAKCVGELGAVLDKDLEDGKLTQADLKDPKKTEDFIKSWIRRAVGVIANLSVTAEVARQTAVGRAKGLKAAEEVVRKLGEGEARKLLALQEKIDAGEIDPEEIDTREAPPSLKHQREDEEAAEKQVPKG